MNIKVYDEAEMFGMYLDWFNNFLTTQRFTEHYGITKEFAENTVIPTGRKILNKQLYMGTKLNTQVPVRVL